MRRLTAIHADETHGLAVVIKDAHGRIMYMNEYNIRLCGWRSSDDTLGYTSDELYPPNQAAVYGGRDREVMETGQTPAVYRRQLRK